MGEPSIKSDIDELRADKNLFHQIVHGDENTTVTTESGVQPSLKKVVADAEATAQAQVNISTNAAAGHASNASDSEQAAGQHASDASQSKLVAQQAETGALAAESGAGVSAGAAKGDADRADQAKAESLQHKLAAEAAEVTATQKAAESKQSEQNAAAVVTGGTATFDPEAGKMPIADSEGLIDSGWMLPVPSRAEFEARQEIARQMYSGSGFVEMGKHMPLASSGLVGDGFYETPNDPNRFRMGRSSSVGGVGESQSDYPVAIVDGVRVSLEGVGHEPYWNNIITLPDAPLATNKVLNGGFDVDLTSWIAGGNWVWDSGVASNDGADTWGTLAQVALDIRAGAVVVISFDIPIYEDGQLRVDLGSAQGSTFSASGTHSVTMVAAEDNPSLLIKSTNLGFSGTVDNISVVDMAEVNQSNIIYLRKSRRSLAAEKFYPFGNRQYGASSYQGVGLSAQSAPFGPWDTVTQGYGHIWGALTAAEKRSAVNEPLSNIENADGQLYQHQYEIKVEVVADSVGSLADLGWTPDAADKGLYRKTIDGVDYEAVPIALVSRRNQGAYHPVFNAQGCSVVKSASVFGGNHWYESAASDIGSTYEAMIPRVGDENLPGFFSVNPGSIAANNPSRPDGKFYDAIYASDVKDVRNNANKVTDLNRTLSRELQRAIAGELRGTEKSKKIVRAWKIGANYPWQGHQVIQAAGSGGSMGGEPLDTYISVTSAGAQYLKYYGWDGAADKHKFNLMPEYESVSLPVSDLPDDGWLIKLEDADTQSSGEILCCDIIGDPANYFRGHYTHKSNAGSQTIATGDVVLVVDGKLGSVSHEGVAGHFYEWLGSDWTGDLGFGAWYGEASLWKDLGPDRPGSWLKDGVFGTPLLVHPDTGASLVPDGSIKDYKLSRKALDVKLVLRDNADKGNTWVDVTAGWAGELEDSANSKVSALHSDYAWVVFYTTKANGWEAADNAEVLALGDVSGMSTKYRADFISHLIDKVGTSNSLGGYALDGLGVRGYERMLNKALRNTTEQAPVHDVLTLASDVSPAVKLLPYLTRENGRLYLQALFKELKFDVDWGDDAKFNVVDGVVTVTDDNGNTVLAGQKRIALPFFISDEV